MRRSRLLVEGARYHVTARTNNHEFLLRGQDAKNLFRSVIIRAGQKYDFKIENFCIMDNHVHFMIYPGKDSLSVIMRWILGVFASQLNKLLHRSGHVWGDRFFSKIIETLRSFFQVLEYIDYNPVKVALAAGPGDWPYCGCWDRRQGIFDLLDDMESTIARASTELPFEV